MEKRGPDGTEIPTRGKGRSDRSEESVEETDRKTLVVNEVVRETFTIVNCHYVILLIGLCVRRKFHMPNKFNNK